MKLLPLLLLCLTTNLMAQRLPTVRTSQERLKLYINKEKAGFGNINQLPLKFDYGFDVTSAGVPMAVVSEKDSIYFVVHLGQRIIFQVVREQTSDTVTCAFFGVAKKAVFNQAYIKTHTSKSLVEMPEVYELANVLIALTAEGQADKGLIYKDTDYYKQVMTYFKPYQHHPAVARFDSLLKADQYSLLKMDSYAYSFQGDKLTKSEVFDRTGWADQNTLTRHIPLVADFARRSHFRTFYREHQPYYAKLIADYQQNIDLVDMKQWLEKQFPDTKYSCLKAVVSPLVDANQSATYFDDNGFREAQAHINFPYRAMWSELNDEELVKGKRRQITFTEFNHSYLNPEAEKYQTMVDKEFSDLKKWTAGKATASYQNPLLCFEEYMNWALVTLYHADHFKDADFDLLRKSVEDMMVERRGFNKFREFDQELLRLYRSRKPVETVADLYPAILAWAARQ